LEILSEENMTEQAKSKLIQATVADLFKDSGKAELVLAAPGDYSVAFLPPSLIHLRKMS
jgi:hypothetical protein